MDLIKNGIKLFTGTDVSILDGGVFVDGVYTPMDTLGVEIVESINVTQTLTPRQFRLALLQANLLDDVESMTAGSREHQIYFEYSLEFERNHPLLITMAESMGLTDSQIDELFILGGSL